MSAQHFMAIHSINVEIFQSRLAGRPADKQTDIAIHGSVLATVSSSVTHVSLNNPGGTNQQKVFRNKNKKTEVIGGTEADFR